MMNVRKFLGATSREAYRLVREALGSDAIILSNRSVGNGVEILALANEDMHSILQSTAEPKPRLTSSSSSYKADRMQERELERPASCNAPQILHPSIPVTPSPSPISSMRQSSGTQPGSASDVSQRPASPPRQADAITPQITQVVREIQSMRGMLETQLAEISWSGQQEREPVRKEILRELLAAGFSAGLARDVVKKMPSGMELKEATRWLKSVLARNLATIGNESEILEKGGVFALVGPTGVGKTTTTAKLAARCVMRHGPSKLALITTDGYRIGAYEQLRIYGKILGVMVHSVKDDADLRIALQELKHKHTVLIDTIGVGQRDNMVAEQVAMLAGAGAPVKRLLCLSATSNGETLSEVAAAYRGNGLSGCIITKLDEATTIGSALDVAIREKLNVFYMANGQRVPEDLHVASADFLADRAFRFKRRNAAFGLQDDELPLVVAGTSRVAHGSSMQGVSLG